MATSEGGPIFLKSIDGTMKYKDRYCMTRLYKEAIIEVGVENVVQFIIGNDSVCKVEGLLPENDYPHIFWTPCVVHMLNLSLKNVLRRISKRMKLYTLRENDSLMLKLHMTSTIDFSLFLLFTILR